MRNDTLHHAPSAVNRLRSLVWLPLLSMALLAALPVAVAAQEVDMKTVEAAVLKEDWKSVVKLLDAVSDDAKRSPDPVLRLIKGHACLSLNRNNEAVCLFFTVSRDEDLDEYDRWPKDFVGKTTGHSNHFVPDYFQGDALARKSQCDRASEAFNRADRQRPVNGRLFM